MFGVDSSELAFIALVALLVIGPKDLPKAMRFVGQWVGRARGVMAQFRAGFDAMLRESELKELEAKWAAENERIMREFPAAGAAPILDAMQGGSDRNADGAVTDHDGGPVMVEQPRLRDATPGGVDTLSDDEIAEAEGVPVAPPTAPSLGPYPAPSPQPAINASPEPSPDAVGPARSDAA